MYTMRSARALNLINQVWNTISKNYIKRHRIANYNDWKKEFYQIFLSHLNWSSIILLARSLISELKDIHCTTINQVSARVRVLISSDGKCQHRVVGIKNIKKTQIVRIKRHEFIFVSVIAQTSFLPLQLKISYISFQLLS